MFHFSMLISALVFLSLDFVYLNVMKEYFAHQIQRVQGSAMQMNYLGVGICYTLLIVGINYFIIRPRKSVSDAFLLGLVIYGVYESTNYALLKNWSILSVLIDTLWGGTLFATTAYIVQLLQ